MSHRKVSFNSLAVDAMQTAHRTVNIMTEGKLEENRSMLAFCRRGQLLKVMIG